MSRRGVVGLLCILSAAGGALLLPAGQAVSQELRQVFVTNWPDVYAVKGEVSVRGPIPQGVQVELADIVVPPVDPKDTQRLVDAGTIDTEGFSQVVLSLAGQIRGENLKSGAVGAILIPDVDPVKRAFSERGEMHFQLKVAASSPQGTSPFFASNQPSYPIGFARYRVLLYNTTAKSVTANLYAYLTNR